MGIGPKLDVGRNGCDVTKIASEKPDIERNQCRLGLRLRGDGILSVKM